MTDNSDPVALVLGRLKGVRAVGPDKWAGRCPAHHDRRASLSVGRGNDGRVLLHCHGGCKGGDICKALGLTLRDLFPVRQNDPAGPSRIVATSDYRDARGELLYQVIRLDPKAFRQRRPDGTGGWTWNVAGVPRVLYRLPELLAASPAEPVFIVEGEKDTDNLARLGLVATTNSGGAGRWSRLSDDSALHGRQVVIVPDQDKAGRAHARDVAARLAGKAAEIRVLDLRGIRGFMGNDVSDLLESDWLDAKELDEVAAVFRELGERAPSPDDWQRRRVDRAAGWLAGQLAAGPHPAADLLAAAEQVGIAIPTLRRAGKRLSVVSRRVGLGRAGRWWWCAADDDASGGDCRLITFGKNSDNPQTSPLPDPPEAACQLITFEKTQGIRHRFPTGDYGYVGGLQVRLWRR